ncbi:uncharacterized protein LOC126374555 [Pectinophora gossypiella]|uniref:Uncharacterized protein n=1 Tax=Pectinophora gossypiella TaxID=13191 RepID=A0A1E1VY21_PECGO|nr:uncharacterized protein LOC126374555 [Pectinophora gossypiella]
MLQLQLKAETKRKLYEERQVYKLRNAERSLCEELFTVKSEIEFLTEQLEELKDKISETSYAISNMEMQKAAESSKLNNNIQWLDRHKREFDEIFAAEQKLLECRNNALKEKEAEEQELERQKQKEIEKQNHVKANEASAIEEECSEIERECAVLKKRNAAIMLKLRRKLVETEDVRRELLNKQEPPLQHNEATQ